MSAEGPQVWKQGGVKASASFLAGVLQWTELPRLAGEREKNKKNLVLICDYTVNTRR
jgi:hypothetical protein